ncbi:hypothetical protein CEXT_289081 [Caerostris extrusa]|uniref:Uncharacterized protein n=1 Tax=Caerostris extrusa TaxID=172846 RepID=A0AAV4Y303_CAEEX|nr:hypothetical protein CEXT_289081 [Caerostris extrusa]
MDLASDSFPASLERILQADPVTEVFGSFELQVACVTLLLSAGPILLIPFLHYLKRNIYPVVCAFFIGLFLIIQYCFAWIVWISERFQQLVNTSTFSRHA